MSLFKHTMLCTSIFWGLIAAMLFAVAVMKHMHPIGNQRSEVVSMIPIMKM
jgi:hypothetical protein